MSFVRIANAGEENLRKTKVYPQSEKDAMAATEQEPGICQPPSSGISASLADKAPAVLQAYFAENPNTFLTQHHIASYESFVFRELPDIILSENPITILKEPIDAERGIYKYKTEIFIGGDVNSAETLGLDVGAPVITLDDGNTVRRMFPNEARLRNLTYAATFQADILIRMTFTAAAAAAGGGAAGAAEGTPEQQVRELRFNNFPLFKLPILLRSKLCATHGADRALLFEMGECNNDQGGYFVVDGSEKVLITRQEQAFNSVYVEKRPASDLKIDTYASVVCQHPVTKQTRRVALSRLHASSTNEEGAIRVSLPLVKGTIPLFVLFRALGVESDRDIVRMILPDADAPGIAAAEATLVASIHDAWPITNSRLAIEFIRTLTTGFIVEHVLDILHTHVFSHVPDRPLARAQYLAELVRKMIRVEQGAEPSTNRDDIRNQRLLPAGTLLRGLFTECWKSWKKAVRLEVDKTYNYNRTLYQDENFLNIFSAGNISKVLMPGMLNDALMRGFRGKWGTNEYNTKTGVIQPLARISFLDAMSHTRRVVSDFDTSMKLTGPRQLHTSQVGYFCTSETPTGAHIGATKNLSILTAISIYAPSAAFTNWLLTRGGVLDVARATAAVAATATSVQINGGTIGFTQDPLRLTQVLKLMKWTACLPPTASISFNTGDNIVRIYLDDGRPLRPLWHLQAEGAWPQIMLDVHHGKAAALPGWRALVCGTYPPTASFDIYSAAFLDPLAAETATEKLTLDAYVAHLAPYAGAVEYVDPYEGNEAYISWWGRVEDLSPTHTHAEIHPSSLMGLLASMIPFANHNQAPRNQLSCSQSKQGIGYYATNYENRFDTYGSMLCYGEGALSRTIVHDAVAGGAMPYGTNLVFALACFNGYNQDDGILFNRSSIERGLFRSLAFRSYETVEEVDPISKAVYRIGNPHNVLAWTTLKAGVDYSQLDEFGVIKEGTVITDKTVLVGRYLTNPETGAITDASLLPTVFTKGRVDRVVVLHQADGMRLVRVRIFEERVPELGDKFCLTPDHDVLTANRGWIPISDVTCEDRVEVYDPANKSVAQTSPLEVLAFEHSGEMFEIEVQDGVAQTVTAEHRLYIHDAAGERFSKASEVYDAKNCGRVALIGHDGAHIPIQTIRRIDANPSGHVYCLRVPTEIFLVRHNGIVSWTGNSSRHGQKGTMGMLLDAQDMPRTAEGIVPDVVVNPHCIPSRMTIAQMLEQLFGKLGAMIGAKMNATSFMNDEQSFKAIGDALQALGFQRDGEEIMYSGMTGVMFTGSVFIAPLYFMRLKHLTQDKMNSRSTGRKEIRTHQPTGGRGNEGGMRIGEMERDSLIAHGVTDFLEETMMKRSDGTSFWVCNGCGTIPIYNEAQNLFVCPLCDGPLTYQGATADTLGLVLPVKKSRTTFSHVEVPYALKLLDQELTTFMNAGFRFLTEKNSRTFRDIRYEGAAAAVAAEQDAALDATAVAARKELDAQLDAVADAMVQIGELPTGVAADAGAEDAPADAADEDQPAHNERPAPPTIPPGVGVVKFSRTEPQYKEFSPYYPVKLTIDGKIWPTAEHYFQAMKFPDNPEYQELIRAAKTPAQAKKLGKTEAIPIRNDWHMYREQVMADVLHHKFAVPKLRDVLLGTGDNVILYTSLSDNFWGLGKKGTGQNKLGELLMQTRTDLRNAAAEAPAAGGAGAVAPQAAEGPVTAGAVIQVVKEGAAPPAAPPAPAAPAAPAAPPAPAADAFLLPQASPGSTGPVLEISEIDANEIPEMLAAEGAPAPAPAPAPAEGDIKVVQFTPTAETTP